MMKEGFFLQVKIWRGGVEWSLFYNAACQMLDNSIGFAVPSRMENKKNYEMLVGHHAWLVGCSRLGGVASNTYRVVSFSLGNTRDFSGIVY